LPVSLVDLQQKCDRPSEFGSERAAHEVSGLRALII
jgi:hypothetical protein